jgi:uncharacterized damage-inducible protein DinB
MNSEFFATFDSNSKAVIDRLTDFDTDYLNRKPNSAIWSLAQVVDHLTRTDAVMTRVIRGTSQPADRDPAEKVEQIRTRFSDLEQKFSAFGMLLPGNEALEADDVRKRFYDARQALKTALVETKADEICTRFAHPLFGPLTRTEWAWFTIIHTERHLVQFGRIQSMLG